MSDSSWAALVAAHQRARAAPLAAHGNVRSPSTGRAPRHEPEAAILACSDARVPPSVIFDQPAGRLFVVRIAGNTPVPSALASLDYAVAELGIDLVVVLGHTGCGAVTAAVRGTCGGHLEPIVAPICEIARANPDADIDQIAALSVADTMRALARHDGPIGRAAAAGRLDIRGAIHDLRTGRLLAVGSDLVETPSPVEAS